MEVDEESSPFVEFDAGVVAGSEGVLHAVGDQVQQNPCGSE